MKKSKSLQKKYRFNNLLLDERPSAIRKSRAKTALKIASCTLALGVAGFMLYNTISDDLYNSNPPVQDPFVAGNVWDDNGNDIEFGDDGTIITDKMTDADKQVLQGQIKNLVLQDANSRSETQIDDIQDIHSISLLPYNLCEENNEFDKYYLSILFSDSKDLFTLNYFTGKDFVCEEESAKDYFADFVNFLNYECALDNCQKMSEGAKQIQEKLQDQAVFVGDAYLGYRENGDEYYYVPVYNKDGSSSVYSSWRSAIDARDLDPLQELSKQLSGEQEGVFQKTDYLPSTSLQKIIQIFDQIKDNSVAAPSENALKNTKNTFKEIDFTK